MTNETLVHVVDDDEPVRDSLVFLLASAGFEGRAYASPLALLDVLSPEHRGCIVTDVRMPEMSGMDLIRSLKEKQIGLPVIVITGHGDVPLAVEAMKLGAVDFLEKPFDDDMLIAAVQTALASARHAQVEDKGAAAAQECLERLTARERDVLLGLAEGQSNKDIAACLGISPRTVEVHRANIHQKLEAGSLPDLVKIALRAGLIS